MSLFLFLNTLRNTSPSRILGIVVGGLQASSCELQETMVLIRQRFAHNLPPFSFQLSANSSELPPRSYKLSARSSAGFTLVELLVICAILVAITGAMLVSNTRFGGAVLLENLAYDMALSVRESQVFGVSVRRFGTNTYSAGYGMHFALSSPSSYLLFADAVTANGMYDCPTPGSSNCELVTLSNIDRNYVITSLCVTPSNGTEVCGHTSIDVFFQRPEPDAFISVDGVSCALASASCQERARIQVKSPRGDLASVVIDNNGQIFVQKP